MNIDSRSLLQANATILAGLFIFITISATTSNLIPNYREPNYLFTWNYIISGDSHNIPSKLKEYLMNKYSITWLDQSNIYKNDTHIILSSGNNKVVIERKDNEAIVNINGNQVEKFLINN